MGGLRCAKEIIDNFNALSQQCGCMVASIYLADSVGGSGLQPTEEQRDAFLKASKELADVAAGIQAYVGEGQ